MGTGDRGVAERSRPTHYQNPAIRTRFAVYGGSGEVPAIRRAEFLAWPPSAQGVADLNRRISREFIYNPYFTTVTAPLNKALLEWARRLSGFRSSGDCQSTCVRVWRHAMSAAIWKRCPPPCQPPQLVGANASHAGLAVYVLGADLAEFDPANGCTPKEKYVTLAWWWDYSDVAPLI